MLFAELEGVKWDIKGQSEVRKTEEEFLELNNCHIFCYRIRNHGAGFFYEQKISRKYKQKLL